MKYVIHHDIIFNMRDYKRPQCMIIYKARNKLSIIEEIKHPNRYLLRRSSNHVQQRNHYTHSITNSVITSRESTFIRCGCLQV